MTKYKRGDRPDREYTHPKEQELWDEFRYRAIDPVKRNRVNVVRLAQQMGIHEQQARDTVRTWENAGIARPVSHNNYNEARITDKGKFTIDPRKPQDK